MGQLVGTGEGIDYRKSHVQGGTLGASFTGNRGNGELGDKDGSALWM